jgi:hypothetical protein
LGTHKIGISPLEMRRYFSTQRDDTGADVFS